MQKLRIEYTGAYMLLVLVILYLVMIRCLLVFSYSVDLNGIEFGFVHFSQLLLEGKPLYQNPMEFPFIAVLFTPFYPYLLYSIEKLFGYQDVQDIHHLLIIARVLSLCCMCMNVYFIYKIFKRLKLPLFYFLAALTIYLLLISGHFYAARPDAFKTTLFTIFLYTAFQYLFWEQGKAYGMYAVLIGLVAVLFKQDAILNIYIFLIVACIYLRNKKVFLLSCGFTFALLLSLAGVYLVSGKYFFANAFILNIQEPVDILHSMNMKEIGFSFLRLIPLFLLIIYHVFYVPGRKNYPGIERFIIILAIVLVIVSHLSMLRAASFINYAYEAVLLLVLAAALVLKQMEHLILKYLKVFSILSFAYIVMLFFMNTLINNYVYSPQQEAYLKKDYFSMLKERAEVMSIAGNEVCFFPNIKYVIFYKKMNLIFGHDMHIDRFIEAYFGLQIPTKVSLVSTAGYDSWFNDGKVKYILAENNSVNDLHVSKCYPHYHFYKNSGRFKIYRYSN